MICKYEYISFHFMLAYIHTYIHIYIHTYIHEYKYLHSNARNTESFLSNITIHTYIHMDM